MKPAWGMDDIHWMPTSKSNQIQTRFPSSKFLWKNKLLIITYWHMLCVRSVKLPDLINFTKTNNIKRSTFISEVYVMLWPAFSIKNRMTFASTSSIDIKISGFFLCMYWWISISSQAFDQIFANRMFWTIWYNVCKSILNEIGTHDCMNCLLKCEIFEHLFLF